MTGVWNSDIPFKKLLGVSAHPPLQTIAAGGPKSREQAPLPSSKWNIPNLGNASVLNSKIAYNIHITSV